MSKIKKLNYESPEIKYLCNKDKRLAKVISMVGDISYQPHDDGYAFLVHEIIEQMLSIKAGKAIYDRLLSLCNGEITPLAISQLSDDEIRSIGTSSNKVSYIRSLTDAVMNQTLVFEDLTSMSDNDVIKALTKIKGIGQWSAKMYLIFALDRTDILPFEDVAFLQAYRWAYKTTDLSKESITKKCKKWSPYSSIAARYMYKALDTGLTKEEFHLYKNTEE